MKAKINRSTARDGVDKNQCPTCLALFTSLHAFDKHRTGRFGIDRRCRTADGMHEAGMAQRTDGVWSGSRRSSVST